MVYCCVPFCTSRTGKSKISIHDFPSDLLLRKRWLRAVARKNYVPNPNSCTQGVCSLHFLESDYKPTLKKRCLKPNSIPSVFPGYPSYITSNMLSPRKIPEKKSVNTSLNKENGSKVNSIAQISKVISSKKVPDKESVNTSLNEENGSKVNSTPQESFPGCSTQIEYLEPSTEIHTHNSYCQTTWNIDESICQLKQQNSFLRSKMYRLNENLKHLQAQFDETREKLNLFESSTVHSCIDKIVEAAFKNDDQAILLIQQVLHFEEKVP